MRNDPDAKLIETGEWFYAGTTKCLVYLVAREFAPGSGDLFDTPEVRENREGSFFVLRFASPSDSQTINSESGSFGSIAEAKQAASKLCAGIRWTCSNTEDGSS